MLRQSRPPQIAVVRLRKGEWVLPKGKLDDGETPRDAAEREVLEETGHAVSVHEFLGTLAYDAGGRPKIVHYWRMETNGKPTRDLMPDVIAVDWLPLNAAVERLSRDHERAFLANVGPLALESARRSRERRPAGPDKSRRRHIVAPKPAVAAAPLSDDAAAIGRHIIDADAIEQNVAEESPPLLGNEAPDAFSAPAAFGPDESQVEAVGSDTISSDVIRADAMPPLEEQATIEAPPGQRRGVMQRMRRWLRRA